MKNILVPTDFSDNCEKAAKLAIEMAILFNSEIHFGLARIFRTNGKVMLPFFGL